MNHSVFLQDVHSAVAAIPTGCVVAYGQIAYLVGGPQCSRMVGQAIHNVPEDLHLPCHGVVNGQGRLVLGWTEQRALLENEGVRFRANDFVNMKFIDAHVSAGGGMEFAPVNAHEIGANALALFTKNQRQWVVKPLTQESISLFRENCRKYALDARYILPHNSYLVNLGYPEEEGLEKSRTAFLDEMQRCEELDLKLPNFHPGSHLNKVSVEACLDRIAELINIALDETQGVTAVIEDTVGQGSNVGGEFWHLKYIINRVEDRSRVGVCLDTCHTYTAGYDIVNEYDKVFEDLDKTVGFGFLRAIHLNGSKKVLDICVDRHDNIGKGLIGMDLFKRFMKDERFNGMPVVPETPDESLWAEEVRLLRSFK